ncbi:MULTISPECIES: hypothetical protein [unclassified Okeania]|uniref:hypothetical protein n=1 Tax=unclassified Okeania TaxID=2634635 RepID=UPI0013B83EC2|nr:MULTISPECIES: hypothetical protein [unclassified Okeania]NES78395.1 hypothetical protein [Okeania sp. SIO1H4]NET13904.1 hypothetical protein [Okeania sp. SIO1H6]NET21051.1 hypothetical protein [Okeania sp. SIO1H5]NET95082.1 hypothetical protein [Okeania sp. SIO1H2]
MKQEASSKAQNMFWVSLGKFSRTENQAKKDRRESLSRMRLTGHDITERSLNRHLHKRGNTG